MKLERTLEQHANGIPEIIADGSKAQIIYCISDAKKDIETLAKHLGILSSCVKKVLPSDDFIKDKSIPDERIMPVYLSMKEIRDIKKAIESSLINN